jgi:hypothetical protein
MSEREGTTVIVSAAVDPRQRDELERRAKEGDRTISQEIRRALRVYLEADDEGGET